MNQPLFGAHADTLAAAEPINAGPIPPDGLTGIEQKFYRHLLDQAKGRIEQEFLPQSTVIDVLSGWA